MTWFRKRIEDLIPPYRTAESYAFWSPDLCAGIGAEHFPAKIDERTTDVFLTVGTLERVNHTATLWSDDPQTRSAVQRTWLFTMMYSCLVYPREQLLYHFSELLPNNTNIGKLCRSLTQSDSDYRHIRNSLAHGNFDFQGDTVVFNDRQWSASLSTRQVELDCLIVFDVLMSLCQLSHIVAPNQAVNRSHRSRAI